MDNGQLTIAVSPAAMIWISERYRKNDTERVRAVAITTALAHAIAGGLATYSGSKVLPQKRYRARQGSNEYHPAGARNSWRPCRLFQFKDAGVELVVGALLGDQVVVGAPFDDAAVV